MLLDKTIFTPNTTSVIVAHDDKSVKKLFRIIRFAYEQLDLPVKPEAKYDNRGELFFEETNSTIYVALSVRGDMVNHLHISELAFMQDAEDRMIATFAAVSPTGTISIESTAQGIGNYFYDFYTEAEERGFQPHFFPWFYADEYRAPSSGVTFTSEELAIQERYHLDNQQLAWYRNNKALYKAKFAQEFPSTPFEAFISTGSNVFDVSLLQDIKTSEPLFTDETGVYYATPIFGRRYAMGVDSSESVGKDEQAIDVIDVDTGEQVYHFSGQLPFNSFVERVIRIARLFNAFIVPEANNHGYALIKALQEEHDLRIYVRRRYDLRKRQKENRVGWLTTGKTKPILVSALNAALHAGDIIVNNRKTVAQLLSFLYNGSGMEAASGKKDDCVISLGLAWQGVLEELARGNTVRVSKMEVKQSGNYLTRY